MKDYLDFHTKAYHGNCYKSRRFRIVGFPSTHLNLTHDPDLCTIHKDDWLKIRDFLNETYPAEPVEVPQYDVRPSTAIGRRGTDEWEVFKRITKQETTHTVEVYATARGEERAKAVAQALNEAEGL